MRTGLCLISLDAVQSLTRSQRPGHGGAAVPVQVSAWMRCLLALRGMLARVGPR